MHSDQTDTLIHTAALHLSVQTTPAADRNEMPVSENGAPIGVLALFSKQVLSPEEVGILEGIASSASQAAQMSIAEAENAVIQTNLHRAQKMEAIGMMAGGVPTI